MKITVFFRSHEQSNAIVSATRDRLSYQEYDFFDIDFINLDKKNYTKYFKQQEEGNTLPKLVFIWFDEEKIEDYITETYGDKIKVFHFDAQYIKKEYDRYGYKKTYKLSDFIMEEFKKTLVKQEYLFVDVTTGKFSKECFDDISLAKYLRSTKLQLVKDEKEGLDACLEYAQKEKVRLEEKIKEEQDYLASLKAKLKRVEKARVKFEKELQKTE